MLGACARCGDLHSLADPGALAQPPNLSCFVPALGGGEPLRGNERVGSECVAFLTSGSWIGLVPGCWKWGVGLSQSHRPNPPEVLTVFNRKGCRVHGAVRGPLKEICPFWSQKLGKYPESLCHPNGRCACGVWGHHSIMWPFSCHPRSSVLVTPCPHPPARLPWGLPLVQVSLCSHREV